SSYLDPRALKRRLQRLHRIHDPLALVFGLIPHIDGRPCFCGDYIREHAALYYTNVQRSTSRIIAELVDREDLVCELGDCAYAGPRAIPRVRRSAADDQFKFADTFAGCFDRATGNRGLENQRRHRRASFVFYDLARKVRTGLFVASHQKGYLTFCAAAEIFERL